MIKDTIMFQDNKSTILLDNNNKKCKHIDISFVIPNRIKQGEVEVKYCLTEDSEIKRMKQVY